MSEHRSAVAFALLILTGTLSLEAILTPYASAQHTRTVDIEIATKTYVRLPNARP